MACLRAIEESSEESTKIPGTPRRTPVGHIIWIVSCGGATPWEDSGNTCCASNFDDCCDADDGAIAGLVIGIIAAIIIGICASRRPRDFR